MSALEVYLLVYAVVITVLFVIVDVANVDLIRRSDR